MSSLNCLLTLMAIKMASFLIHCFRIGILYYVCACVYLFQCVLKGLYFIHELQWLITIVIYFDAQIVSDWASAAS